MNHNTNIQQDLNSSNDGSEAPPPNISSLFSRSKEVSLTSEEKASGSLFLKDFMEKNQAGAMAADATKSPYAETAGATTGRKTFYSEYFKTLYVKKPELIYALAAFVLIFGSASGAVSAAQDSLPGELLYPVKIQVNERVERAIALTAEAKAKVAAKQAVARLEEAKRLIDARRANAAIEAEAYMRFSSSSDEMEKNIDQLEKNGQYELAITISTDFQKALDRQERDFSAAIEKSSSSSSEPRLSTAREQVRKRINASAKKTIELKSKFGLIGGAIQGSSATPAEANTARNPGSARSKAAAIASTTSGANIKTGATSTVLITSTSSSSTSATTSANANANAISNVTLPVSPIVSPIVAPVIAPVSAPAVVPAVKSVLGL